MIYTLTFNPALDYTVRLDALTVGQTNRSQSQTLRLGGKGLNVSAVLHALGAKTLAYSFSAGEIGKMMKQKALELQKLREERIRRETAERKRTTEVLLQHLHR